MSVSTAASTLQARCRSVPGSQRATACRAARAAAASRPSRQAASACPTSTGPVRTGTAGGPVDRGTSARVGRCRTGTVTRCSAVNTHGRDSRVHGEAGPCSLIPSYLMSPGSAYRTPPAPLRSDSRRTPTPAPHDRSPTDPRPGWHRGIPGSSKVETTWCPAVRVGPAGARAAPGPAEDYVIGGYGQPPSARDPGSPYRGREEPDMLMRFDPLREVDRLAQL